MEKAIDLSGIDPARWPEIRRRVSILDDYIGIARPTVRQTDAHAARMGLRRSTFYALARVWREGRDPRKVAGSGTSKGRRARNETNDLPAVATNIIDTVITDLAPWTEDRDILREAHARLSAARVDASDQAIRLLIDRARACSTERSPFPPAILIERCHLRLPMATGEEVVLPAMCIAIALPENVVIAHRLGTDARPPSVDDVLGDIRGLSIGGSEPRPVIAPAIEDEMPSGVAAMPDNGLERVRLRRVLGGSIGGIEFLVQNRRGGSGVKLRTRFEQPLGRADVELAVSAAVERHNADRGGIPAFSF